MTVTDLVAKCCYDSQKKFYKILHILYHIESLDTCMEY
jgi:hypothetical protein